MSAKTSRYALLGRIGAAVTLSRSNPQQMGARLRAGRWAALLREADPDGALPVAERERRAKELERAHMRRLALKRRDRAAKAKAGRAS